jgi:hypothetical protein
MIDDGEQLRPRGAMSGVGEAVHELESSSGDVSANFEAFRGHRRGIRAIVLVDHMLVSMGKLIHQMSRC